MRPRTSTRDGASRSSSCRLTKNVDWATLEREIRTISALKHPNICTIYEAVQSEGQNFVAMELLEGETLKRKLTGQPLDTEAVLAVGLQIADALDAAHGRGILHRDIRPSTIFVIAQNQVKVLDFGLTQPQCESKTSLEETTRGTAVTASHGISKSSALSKVAYIPPEQARGRQLDPRSDLFCLGAVLYEMATGTMPFRGDTPALVFDALLNRPPVTPTRLNPLLPVKCRPSFSNCLRRTAMHVTSQRSNSLST